ncbi:MAG: cofactor-independent phosphoglycerate mutase [Spirochaetia bacterium]|nr:cofactor-independent phosphoglycerate mutase [Spirochaetia bacterium]
MKYLIILGDGMADRPIEKLGGKTPLMAVSKPSIDLVAKNGRNGMLKTIPDDMPTGSAVANLGVMGYDSHKYFKGRGVLEAANMSLSVDEDDLVFRCNLLNISNKKIINHSAGHISTNESRVLIDDLNKSVKNIPEFKNVKFYPGISFKHILIIKDGAKGGKGGVECTPPHDHPGEIFTKLLVTPINDKAKKNAELVNNLIMHSQEVLRNHPINIERIKSLKDSASSIWPWSPGSKPVMPTFEELYNLNGSVISGVDLINGIGVYAGMDVIRVDGATGLYNTNYEGKAEAAIETLKTHDFLYLHVEATDEAGHDGDLPLKMKCIEYLDKRIVKYILEHKDEIGDELTIAILPDHPTPVEMRIHTREPIPFVIMKPGESPDKVEVYDEKSALKGFYGEIEGAEFINLLIGSSS